MLVRSVSTQSISKPSIPEFTVQYVNHPYDKAPTYTVDPYTGQKQVTSNGGHFNNYSVEVRIKNQVFTPVIDASGNYTSLYYNLRFKGHYEENWTYYPVVPTDYGSAYHPVDPFQTGARGSQYIDASKADYTILTLPAWRMASVPHGGEIDVQVQALIGHDNAHDWGVVLWGELITYYFEGEYTDWSNTATVKLDANSGVEVPSSSQDGSVSLPPTSYPTATPTTPMTSNPPAPTLQPSANSAASQLDWVSVVAVAALGLVAVLVVIVVVLGRRIRRLERKVAS